MPKSTRSMHLYTVSIPLSPLGACGTSPHSVPVSVVARDVLSAIRRVNAHAKAIRAHVRARRRGDRLFDYLRGEISALRGRALMLSREPCPPVLIFRVPARNAEPAWKRARAVSG